MSNILIALIFSLGASAWIYGKLQRRTGGQSKESLKLAIPVGVVAFAFFLILLSMFQSYLNN